GGILHKRSDVPGLQAFRILLILKRERCQKGFLFLGHRVLLQLCQGRISHRRDDGGNDSRYDQQDKKKESQPCPGLELALAAAPPGPGKSLLSGPGRPRIISVTGSVLHAGSTSFSPWLPTFYGRFFKRKCQGIPLLKKS